IVAAIRAAEGEGRDASSTNAAARTALRDLGLTWLDHELEAVRIALDAKTTTSPDALRGLQRWSNGSGVAALRKEELVRAWPEAQQARLRSFWTRWKELVVRVRPAY